MMHVNLIPVTKVLNIKFEEYSDMERILIIISLKLINHEMNLFLIIFCVEE